ncbi:type 1 glutamine amidotransferase domain-containing protein [Hymenobacter terrenus]|uniref:type 1 glutamine amidotransferase domain-containing protein n=1 Tax=Hymenobacter terrenus TaxID=1629124 RepID=UPI0009E56848|nr:type 1 glutamine amidotransferase domain-containing protein [Hymenobacter terrenus]
MHTLNISETGRINQFKASPTVPTLSTELITSAGADENEALRALLLETPNPTQLRGQRFAILSTDGVEELELTVPYQYLGERGATVHLIAPRKPAFPAKFGLAFPTIRATHILTVHYMENAGWARIDRFMDEVSAADYDAVIVPGGAWNPDALRVDADALAFLRAMNEQGKPIGAFCHGPLVLVNAGLLRGKRATAFWNIFQDLENAGAIVEDAPVVVDGNLLTSRYPYDAPAFLQALLSAVAKSAVVA